MSRAGIDPTLVDETQGQFLRDDGAWATPPGNGGGDPSAAWPIGSVFIAVVDTNPATLLGFGTWAAIAAGRVLMGVDAGQSVEDTGGAATHALTVDEMPAHSHGVTDPGHVHVEQNNSATTGGLAGWAARDTSTNTAVATGYSTQSATTGITVQNTGGGAAFSLLPPHYLVRLWKRTA